MIIRLKVLTFLFGLLYSIRIGRRMKFIIFHSKKIFLLNKITFLCENTQTDYLELKSLAVPGNV